MWWKNSTSYLATAAFSLCVSPLEPRRMGQLWMVCVQTQLTDPAEYHTFHIYMLLTSVSHVIVSLWTVTWLTRPLAWQKTLSLSLLVLIHSTGLLWIALPCLLVFSGLTASVEAHLSRFEDNCVSSCQAGCCLPGQHHQRVVPWDHNGTHSEKKRGEDAGAFFQL